MPLSRAAIYQVVGVLSLAFAGCDMAPLSERVATITAEHVAGAPLHVETTNGSIAVTKSAGGEVEIFARIRAQNLDRLDAVEIVAQRSGDRALSVRAKWPDDRPLNREGCSFEIRIPDAVGVNLATDNGSLKLTELAGTAELRSANGSVSVERHDGPVSAQTTNGSVNVAQARGPVRAATVNGSIDVDLTSESTGPVEASTTNGAVNLVVGRAFAGQLSLETTNGTVIVEDSLEARVISKSRKHAQLSFGDVGQSSAATTVNGSVRVSTGHVPAELETGI